MRTSRRPSAAIVFAALLVLGPAGAGAAVQARVVPELAISGGWASAILVGSDFPHWQTHLAPQLAFDLSTGPVVKILSAYRLVWSRYGGDASSLLHDGGITLRIRLAHSLDLEMRGAVERVGFEEIAGSIGGDPAAPPAISSFAFEGGPRIRWRFAERTTAEAELGAGSRANDLGGGEAVDEEFQELQLSVLHRFSPAFDAGLRYRHLRSRASAARWDGDGDGAQITLLWAPWNELVLNAHAGVQWTRFVADERIDRFGYAGVGATLPIAAGASAELAWSLGDNAVAGGASAADRAAFSGSRQMVWSGLRMELPIWL